MRWVRQSGTELLHRQLRPGRRQRLAVFRLGLPVGTVDAPLKRKVRNTVMLESGRPTHVFSAASGALAEASQLPPTAARSLAPVLEILLVHMLQAADARLGRTCRSTEECLVVLGKRAFRKLAARLPLAALAAQSLSHCDSGLYACLEVGVSVRQIPPARILASLAQDNGMETQGDVGRKMAPKVVSGLCDVLEGGRGCNKLRASRRKRKQKLSTYFS
jgi:hypothetical protein